MEFSSQFIYKNHVFYLFTVVYIIKDIQAYGSKLLINGKNIESILTNYYRLLYSRKIFYIYLTKLILFFFYGPSLLLIKVKAEIKHIGFTFRKN